MKSAYQKIIYSILALVMSMFLVFNISQNVQACVLCDAENELVYHYYCSELTGYGCHFSKAFKYKPDSISAPVYEIYATVENMPYIILLSSNDFQVIIEDKNGNTIDCSWAGGSGQYITSRYFIQQLGMGKTPMESWEYTSTSRGVPVNQITLPNINSQTILAIDTTEMIPLLNSDGSIYEPDRIVFDPMTSDYDSTLPAPDIYYIPNTDAVDDDAIGFRNAMENVYVLAYGRWNTIEDIEPFKESLTWKYKYNTILTSNLEQWIMEEDYIPSGQTIPYYDMTRAQLTFEKMLAKYPVESRNFIGNDGSLTHKLFGYDDAVNDCKMFLSNKYGPWNKVDLYFRYYYVDDGNIVHYSKWTHFVQPLPKSGTTGSTLDNPIIYNDYRVSGDPLTTDEVFNGDGIFSDNLIDYNKQNNTEYFDIDSVDYTMSIDNLSEIMGLFGALPLLAVNIFGFLPTWMLALLGGSLTMLMALAIYHGVRG